METISPFITTTKNYIVVKIPREGINLDWLKSKIQKKGLKEQDVLQIIEQGESEYKKNKIIDAPSLKEGYSIYKKSL